MGLRLNLTQATCIADPGEEGLLHEQVAAGFMQPGLRMGS